MKLTGPLALFALALVVHAAVAVFVSQPGYMDAYYYYGGALRLAQGHGFTETYLWNYLDDPAGLPHPSHLYWMPLTSVVAAASMAIFGQTFRAAQLPFVLLASLLPPLTYWLTWHHSRNLRHAWTAGLLAVFSGFHLPFLPNTDSFALFALLGAGCILAAVRGVDHHRPAPYLLLAGALGGLAGLTRADGILLAIACLAWMAWEIHRQAQPRSGHALRLVLSDWLYLAACFALGYLLASAPWWWRNVQVVGSPFPPGGMRAAWLVRYDELFSFPPQGLTLSHYLSQGWGSLLRGKWEGLWNNLQTALAVQASIFLAPFILAGLWRGRGRPVYRFAALYYAALFAVMTFVFTFPGVRGGLFHSGMVLIPFFLSAAPEGLDALVERAARVRKTWNVAQARRVFSIGLVVMAAGLSGSIAWAKLIGPDWRDPAWGRVDGVYRPVGEWLDANASPEIVVLTNNPPGFFYHTGLRSVVIPNGGTDTLLAVADKYKAGFVLLDANHPEGLAGLYAGQERLARLELLKEFVDGDGRPVLLFGILPHE